jgi:hypothetical protein
MSGPRKFVPRSGICRLAAVQDVGAIPALDGAFPVQGR